jgi:large subunit ribosomal protein L17
MRHQNDGRKFSRNTSHRMAIFRNMANSFIISEQFVTTTPKAKEVRRVVDRLVTLGKKGTHHTRRLAFNRTRSKEVVEKLFGVLAERYKARQGGYTRVLKLSAVRRGDGSDMAILELVDHPPIDRKKQQVETVDEKTTNPQTAKDALAAAKKAFSGSKKKSVTPVKAEAREKKAATAADKPKKAAAAPKPKAKKSAGKAKKK